MKLTKVLKKLKSLKTFSTSNSRAKDKNLEVLQDIENVFLGDSYPKNSIEDFSKKFTGENLWIYGKAIKGEFKSNSPFKI